MEAKISFITQVCSMRINKLRAICALSIPVLGPIGILLTLPVGKLSEIRFDIRLLVASLSLFVLFFLSYSVVLNEGILRGAYLILANFILYSILRSRSWSENAFYVSDVIYTVNVLILIFSSLFDPVAMLFSRAGVGVERIGGLIGYDFVAFFVSIYIISRIEADRLDFGWPLFLHLGLATFVTLVSGRFGFLILLLLYLYVLMRFASMRMILIISMCGVGGYLLNFDRINLIFNTALGVYEYIATDSMDVLNSISADGASGFYAASPLTWLSEFGLAFGSLSEHLFPSNVYSVVDNGPAYMILNSGLFLTVLFYSLFFWFLRAAHASNVFIMLIAVAADLKFRSAFTVFPMLWIYLNCAFIRKNPVI